MRMAALRCGALLNQSELARDAGLTQPTAHRYLNLLEAGSLEGPLVESLVLADLLAWRAAAAPEAGVLYWRNVSGDEVDFVIERGARVIPLEVKAGRRSRAGA